MQYVPLCDLDNMGPSDVHLTGDNVFQNLRSKQYISL